jgi:hypothetical protein
MGYCYCRRKREFNEDKCRRVITNVHLKQRKATEEKEGGHLRKENVSLVLE